MVSLYSGDAEGREAQKKSQFLEGFGTKTTWFGLGNGLRVLLLDKATLLVRIASVSFIRQKCK